MANSHGAIRRPSTTAHSSVGRPAGMKRLDAVIARQINACGAMNPCEKCFALLLRRPWLDRLGIDRAPAAVVLTPAASR